jgi:hypothetical protein
MNDSVIAKDKIGKCRYIIRQAGRMLTITMMGYGLKAIKTYQCRCRDFNHDAQIVRDRLLVPMVRDMEQLARLSTRLGLNLISGIPPVGGNGKPSRPARGKNPLDSIRV